MRRWLLAVIVLALVLAAEAEAFAKKKKKKKGTKKRKLGSDDFVLRDEDVAEEEPPTGGAQLLQALQQQQQLAKQIQQQLAAAGGGGNGLFADESLGRPAPSAATVGVAQQVKVANMAETMKTLAGGAPGGLLLLTKQGWQSVPDGLVGSWERYGHRCVGHKGELGDRGLSLAECQEACKMHLSCTYYTYTREDTDEGKPAICNYYDLPSPASDTAWEAQAGGGKGCFADTTLCTDASQPDASCRYVAGEKAALVQSQKPSSPAPPEDPNKPPTPGLEALTQRELLAAAMASLGADTDALLQPSGCAMANRFQQRSDTAVYKLATKLVA